MVATFCLPQRVFTLFRSANRFRVSHAFDCNEEQADTSIKLLLMVKTKGGQLRRKTFLGAILGVAAKFGARRGARSESARQRGAFGRCRNNPGLFQYR